MVALFTGGSASSLPPVLRSSCPSLLPAEPWQPLPPELRDEMRGVIDRSHRLGLQVIGQAVEDPQAAAALWMGGIDFIQGNLVQRAEQALDFDFQHATL